MSSSNKHGARIDPSQQQAYKNPQGCLGQIWLFLIEQRQADISLAGIVSIRIPGVLNVAGSLFALPDLAAAISVQTNSKCTSTYTTVLMVLIIILAGLWIGFSLCLDSVISFIFRHTSYS